MMNKNKKMGRKRKYDDTCSDMQWFIDVIGDTNILYRFIEKPSHRVTLSSRKALKDRGPGIHFYNGHWYSRCPRESEVYNPYDKHQVRNSNHMCPTFSTMHYQGSNVLRDNQYEYNFRMAIQFWIDELNSDPVFAKYFLQKIHEYGNDNPTMRALPMNTLIKDLKITDVKSYLQYVKRNANKFINC